MTSVAIAPQQPNCVRELAVHEIEGVAGGLDIGPLHIESGKGLVTIDIGGYGVWFGEGCVGALTPNRVVGACIR